MDLDTEIFAELYPSLRRFAAVVGPIEVDPDDLVQDALVRTLAIGPLHSLDHPSAYLRAAIVRLAANHRRSLGRRRRALARDTWSEQAAVEYPSDLSDLLRLGVEDRAALYLVVVEDQPYRDVALVLGCREGTARMRVARALRRLRVELTEERQEIGDA